MSEHIDEQISEFIDDEMSAEECEFFVRRLARDEGARERYRRYHLIGAAMRGEHVGANAALLGQRLDAALDGRPPAAARAGAFGWFTAGRAAIGAGIAASVALVAVLGLRLTALDPAAEGSSASVAANEAPSYVVPAASAETPPLVPLQAEVAGIQYLIHHTGYSSGLNRTIMRSSVVAGPESDAAAASGVAD